MDREPGGLQSKGSQRVETQLKRLSTHTQSAYPKVVPKAHSLFFYKHFLKCHLLSKFFLAVVQSLSHVQHFAILWTAARQASPSFTISQSLLKLMSIESVMPPNHIVLCHPLLLCPLSFLTSGSFPMSHLFASGGQSIRASASVSVLPMNIQDWFHLELTGWISLQSNELSGAFSNTTAQKHQFFSAQLSLWFSSPYMNTVRMHVRRLSLSLTILKKETHTHKRNYNPPP